MMLHVLDSDEIDLPFNDLVLFRDIEGKRGAVRRAVGVPQGVWPAA